MLTVEQKRLLLRECYPSISAEEINRLAESPELQQAVVFIEQNYSDYLPLISMLTALQRKDPTTIASNAKLFTQLSQIMQAALPLRRIDTTISFASFNQAAFTHAYQAARIEPLRSETLAELHSNTDNLSIAGKFLAGALERNEWLSDLDLQRLLTHVGLQGRVEVVDCNPLEIGTALHIARLKAVEQRATEPYTVRFIVNTGVRGNIRSQGNHWITLAITIDPSERTAPSILIGNSDRISEEDWADLQRIICNGIRYPAAERTAPANNVVAFPRITPQSINFSSMICPRQSDGWRCGYCALQNTVRSALAASEITADHMDAARAIDAIDAQAMHDTMYGILLRALRLPSNQLQRLPEALRNEFAPVPHDASKLQLKETYIQRFLQHIGRQTDFTIPSRPQAMSLKALEESAALDQAVTQQYQAISKILTVKVQIAENKRSLTINLTELFDDKAKSVDTNKQQTIWLALVKFLNEQKIDHLTLALESATAKQIASQYIVHLEQLAHFTRITFKQIDLVPDKLVFDDLPLPTPTTDSPVSQHLMDSLAFQTLSQTLIATAARNKVWHALGRTFSSEGDLWDNFWRERFANVGLLKDEMYAATARLAVYSGSNDHAMQKINLDLLSAQATPLEKLLNFIERHALFFKAHLGSFPYKTLSIDDNGAKNFTTQDEIIKYDLKYLATRSLATIAKHLSSDGYFPFEGIAIDIKYDKMEHCFPYLLQILKQLKKYPHIDHVTLNLPPTDTISDDQCKVLTDLYKSQGLTTLFTVTPTSTHSNSAAYLDLLNTIAQQRAAATASQIRSTAATQAIPVRTSTQSRRMQQIRDCKSKDFNPRGTLVKEFTVSTATTAEKITQRQNETRLEINTAINTVAVKEQHHVSVTPSVTGASGFKGAHIDKNKFITDEFKSYENLITQGLINQLRIPACEGAMDESTVVMDHKFIPVFWDRIVGSPLQNSIRYLMPAALQRIFALPQYFRDGVHLDNLPTGFYVQQFSHDTDATQNGLVLCYDATKFIENKNQSALTPQLVYRPSIDKFTWQGDLRQFFPAADPEKIRSYALYLLSNGYDLHLMSDGREFKPNTLYLSETSDGYIAYSVITPTGESVRNIPTNIPAPTPFTLSALRQIRAQILTVTSSAGHTYPATDIKALEKFVNALKPNAFQDLRKKHAWCFGEDGKAAESPFSHPREWCALIDLLYRAGIPLLENFLDALKTLHTADPTFYQHFKQAFLSEKGPLNIQRGTTPSFADLNTPETMKIICELSTLSAVEKKWWKKIVNAQSVGTGTLDLPTLYNGFKWFLGQLPKGIVLPDSCPIQGPHEPWQPLLPVETVHPNPLVTLDRILGILGKVPAHNLQDQLNNLSGLDLGPCGAWYAARWDRFHYVHSAMELSAAKANKAGNFRVTYQELVKLAQNPETTSFAEASIAFHRFIGLSDGICVPYQSYVNLTEALNQLTGVPDLIKIKLLPLLAIATTGPRGSQPFDHAALLAYVSTKAADPKLVETLDEIAQHLEHSSEKPTLDELTGLIKLGCENDKYRPSAAINLCMGTTFAPISEKILRSWAIWNSHDNNHISASQFVQLYIALSAIDAEHMDQWAQIIAVLKRPDGDASPITTTAFQTVINTIKTHAQYEFILKTLASIQVQPSQADAPARELPTWNDISRLLTEISKTDFANAAAAIDYVVHALPQCRFAPSEIEGLPILTPNEVTLKKISTTVDFVNSQFRQYNAAKPDNPIELVDKEQCKGKNAITYLIATYKSLSKDLPQIGAWAVGEQLKKKSEQQDRTETTPPESKQKGADTTPPASVQASTGNAWGIGAVFRKLGGVVKTAATTVTASATTTLSHVAATVVTAAANTQSGQALFLAQIRPQIAEFFSDVLLQPLETSQSIFPALAALYPAAPPTITGNPETLEDEAKALDAYVKTRIRLFEVLADLRKQWGDTFTLDFFLGSPHKALYSPQQLTRIFEAIRAASFNRAPTQLLDAIFAAPKLPEGAIPGNPVTDSLTSDITEIIQLRELSLQQKVELLKKVHDGVASTRILVAKFSTMKTAHPAIPEPVWNYILNILLTLQERPNFSDIVLCTQGLLRLYENGTERSTLDALFKHLSKKPQEYEHLVAHLENLFAHCMIPETEMPHLIMSAAAAVTEQTTESISSDDTDLKQLVKEVVAETQMESMAAATKNLLKIVMGILQQPDDNPRSAAARATLFSATGIIAQLVQLYGTQQEYFAYIANLYDRTPRPNLTQLQRFLDPITASLSEESKQERIRALIANYALDPFGKRTGGTPAENEAELAAQFSLTVACERISEIRDLGRDRLHGEPKPLFFTHQQQLYDALGYITAVGYTFPLTIPGYVKDDVTASTLRKPILELTGDEIQRLTHHYRAVLSGTIKPPVSPEQHRIAQLEFLALMREALYRTTGKFPYSTQILSILNVILHGGSVFSEIRTGEGKSIITALLATMKWVTGGAVDVCTANRELARRDLEELHSFYDYIGIPTALISAESPYDTYKQDGINYADMPQLSLWQQTQLLSGRVLPDKAALVIDEVDYAALDLITQFRLAIPLDASFDPHQNPDEPFYPLVLNFVRTEQFENGTNANNEKFTRGQDIANLREFVSNSTLSQHQKSRFAELPDEKLDVWLDAAPRALHLLESEDYTIESSVLQKGTDKIPVSMAHLRSGHRIDRDSRLGESVHQFLHVRLNEEMEKDPGFKTRCGGLRFPIEPEKIYLASRSAKNVLDYYLRSESGKPPRGEVVGLTGTIGTFEEIKELITHYGVRAFSIPPHQKLRRKDLDPVLVTAQPGETSAGAHQRVILEAIVEARKKNQAVLIICDSVKESQALHTYLNNHFPKEYLQLFNGEQPELKESDIVEKAGTPLMVTVSTPMLGRGTDIKTPDAPKGLRVIVTGLAHEREYRQNIGRAGRNGAKGKSQLILSPEAFTEHGITTPTDQAALSDAIRTVRLSIAKKQGKDRFERELFADIKDQIFQKYITLCRDLKADIVQDCQSWEIVPDSLWETVSHHCHEQWSALLIRLDEEWGTVKTEYLDNIKSHEKSLTELQKNLNAATKQREKKQFAANMASHQAAIVECAALLEKKAAELATFAEKEWGKVRETILTHANSEHQKTYSQLLPAQQKDEKKSLSITVLGSKHTTTPILRQLPPIRSRQGKLNFSYVANTLRDNGVAHAECAYHKMLHTRPASLDNIIARIAAQLPPQQERITTVNGLCTVLFRDINHYQESLRELAVAIVSHGTPENQTTMRDHLHRYIETIITDRSQHNMLHMVQNILPEVRTAKSIANLLAVPLIEQQRLQARAWHITYRFAHTRLRSYRDARFAWRAADREQVTDRLLMQLEAININIRQREDMSPQLKLQQLRQALDAAEHHIDATDLATDTHRTIRAYRNQNGSRLKQIIQEIRDHVEAMHLATAPAIAVPASTAATATPVVATRDPIQIALGTLRNRAQLTGGIVQKTYTDYLATADSTTDRDVTLQTLLLYHRLKNYRNMLLQQPKLNTAETAFLQLLTSTMHRVNMAITSRAEHDISPVVQSDGINFAAEKYRLFDILQESILHLVSSPDTHGITLTGMAEDARERYAVFLDAASKLSSDKKQTTPEQVKARPYAVKFTDAQQRLIVSTLFEIERICSDLWPDITFAFETVAFDRKTSTLKTHAVITTSTATAQTQQYTFSLEINGLTVDSQNVMCEALEIAPKRTATTAKDQRVVMPVVQDAIPAVDPQDSQFAKKKKHVQLPATLAFVNKDFLSKLNRTRLITEKEYDLWCTIPIQEILEKHLPNIPEDPEQAKRHKQEWQEILKQAVVYKEPVDTREITKAAQAAKKGKIDPERFINQWKNPHRLWSSARAVEPLAGDSPSPQRPKAPTAA